MDREFWTVDILRASQTHAAMWHAVLALTAAHADLQGVGHQAQSSVLQHCNSSVQHLLHVSSATTLNQLDKEIILMTSVLLIGLFSLKRDLPQAVTLARHGLKLLHEWEFLNQSQTSSGAILSSKHLAVQLQRAQAHYLWPGIESNRVPWLAPLIPPANALATPFASATDAMLELQPLIMGAAEAVRSDRMYVDSEVSPRRDPRLPYRVAFAVWRNKFSELKAMGDGMADKGSMLILEEWALCVELLLVMDVWQSELGYDNYAALFERMNNVAEQVIEEDEKRAESGRPTPFSFEMSLNEPLFVVALACRVRSKCHRAISLMKRWSRTEGMWSSGFLAAVAEAAAMAEESGSLSLNRFVCPCVPGSFVCGRHRVFSTVIGFVDNGLARVNINSIEGFLEKSRGATYYIQY